MNPGTSILFGILVLVILAWAFWPNKGLLSLLTRFKMNTRKVQLEDALKFLFDCEYKKMPCGLHSIAGNLNISSNKAANILESLQAMGLITQKGESFELTDSGRSYALRVIRVHRIWEKYLAEETGIAQKEWHGAADLQEHLLSEEATEKLAGRIGNPVFDPHGDPIPSAKGELPLHKGKSLSDLQEGDIGRIVHIEDEPGYIYEQLTALGIYPGMQIYVLAVTNGKISFAAEGEEHILTSLFASAITVEISDNKEPLAQRFETLSSLRLGEKAEIVGISHKCIGQQRRRLLDLGIVPGTIVTAEIRSSSGDPVGYRIKGATIGIRKKQADQVFINKELKHEQSA
jgi:DtxR family Mn-dependent transcriptional regulator